ncbi:hypothetical protein EPN18_06840 [bacterium]|nr:MAG: hypothetical protein EPN18_06840 [bacterium]
MSLLEKLKGGKRNTKVVKFPGTDDDVALVILSNHELQDSIFAAEGYFKAGDITVSATTLDAYEDERTTQILFRALRSPDNLREPFAATVTELRKSVTREEKDLLVKEYVAFEQECSPQFETLPDGDFDKLWEDLKKNPEAVLNSLNFRTLKKLVLYLALRQGNSPADNGSTS